MTVDKWDQRQLCSDGACVGVIGPDGTCKVCGRAAPNWGDERTRGLNPPAEDGEAAEPADDESDDEEFEDDDDYEDEDDDEDYEDGDDDGEQPEGGAMRTSAASGSPASGEPVWDERELCSDGACIGVIGDDGVCKVCGKPGKRPAVARVMAASEVITTDDAVGDASQVATSEAIASDPAPDESPDGDNSARTEPEPQDTKN